MPFAFLTVNVTDADVRTPWLSALAADAGSARTTPGLIAPLTAREETGARSIAIAFVILRPWPELAIASTPLTRTEAF
ncbi:MAG: hypothetical protein QOI18_1942 [Solirubrobacteraceae bacterium]|nr:hypothetical protein [Solirubrobacteraceae bacterium]